MEKLTDKLFDELQFVVMVVMPISGQWIQNPIPDLRSQIQDPRYPRSQIPDLRSRISNPIERIGEMLCGRLKELRELLAHYSRNFTSPKPIHRSPR